MGRCSPVKAARGWVQTVVWTGRSLSVVAFEFEGSLFLVRGIEWDRQWCAVVPQGALLGSQVWFQLNAECFSVKLAHRCDSQSGSPEVRRK